MLVDKAIEALIALKLPLKVKTNYKISQISLAIRSQASVIEMTKSQLIDKHGVNGVVDPNMPGFPSFMKEWKEVADIEIEVEVDKIKLEELDIDGVNIPIEIFRDLNPFIEK